MCIAQRPATPSNGEAVLRDLGRPQPSSASSTVDQEAGGEYVEAGGVSSREMLEKYSTVMR